MNETPTPLRSEKIYLNKVEICLVQRMRLPVHLGLKKYIFNQSKNVSRAPNKNRNLN